MTPAQKTFYKKQFWKNLRKMHRMASFWVMTAASGAAAYWLQLTPEEQQKLIESYPFLIKASPLISAAAWIYARAKAQQSLTPPPEDEGDMK